jgi:hypothetical protein
VIHTSSLVAIALIGAHRGIILGDLLDDRFLLLTEVILGVRLGLYKVMMTSHKQP